MKSLYPTKLSMTSGVRQHKVTSHAATAASGLPGTPLQDGGPWLLAPLCCKGSPRKDRNPSFISMQIRKSKSEIMVSRGREAATMHREELWPFEGLGHK